MRHPAPLLAMAFALCLTSAACDDNRTASGCSSDADCRGLRICVDSVCENPDDPNPTPEPQPTPEPEPEPMPTPEPGPGPPENICQQAINLLVSCDLTFITPEQNRLGWPECGQRDACAAQCAFEVGCGGLECSWHPDVDCDEDPFEACIAQNCDEDVPPDPPIECDSDADCGQTFDCCGVGWLCFPNDNPPFTCDLECGPMIPEPGDCLCQSNFCVQQDGPELPPENICEEGLQNFRDCGYTLEDARDPIDAGLIQALENGACDPVLACYAGCLAFDDEDPCLTCHFGPAPCDQDPFAECVDRCNGDPESALCIQTGGLWGDSDCEDCCGPTVCGQDPGEQCFEPCCGPPQCYCPNDAPFWAPDRGCYDEDACYP